MDKHLTLLEWHVITGDLAGHALCAAAKERCLNLVPLEKLEAVRRAQKETSAGRAVMDAAGTPPLAAMAELQKALKAIELDSMLLPEQLQSVATFLITCRRMKTYLQRAQVSGSEVADYGRSIVDLKDVADDIERCIRSNQVDDRASDKLQSLRRRIQTSGEAVKGRLNTLLQKNPKWFSESFVSIRNGRYTLPVKREYKASVPGQLVDLSASGATCFIEPASVGKLIDEINGLLIEEDAEVRRVLYELTALVAQNLPAIRLNIEAMETLDFLFAKAKYANALCAREAQMAEEGRITLIQARHPLLNAQTAVPLDFAVGGDIMGVVVTGPNTGGKTVALKTVGLLSLMAQSGLHVPAGEGSAFLLRDKVLCDIGDGQSITENLSTFSSHIVNVTGILKTAGRRSLVLLDELGSGTDPQEGMGIAVAILDELCRIGCLFAATTHYPEIKAYAAQKPGLINARMAFDRESLSPLFTLEIGAAGESCALFIAKALGFPEHLLEAARQAAYTGMRVREAIPEALQSVVPVQINTAIEAKPLPRSARFNLGDSVRIYPQKDIGVVFLRADDKGMVGVIVKGKKSFFNHKRLKLHVAAAELYPEDYDFSVVFDSVAVRKAHKSMTKHHNPNLVIREEELHDRD